MLWFCSVEQEDMSDVYDFGVILLELILGRTIKSRNVDTLKDLVMKEILVNSIFSSFIFFLNPLIIQKLENFGLIQQTSW